MIWISAVLRLSSPTVFGSRKRRICHSIAPAAGILFLFAFTAAAQLPPSLIYRELLNTNPGWSTQGDWAFGVPTGGTGAFGGADPTSGCTGANVYGYNLTGSYSNMISSAHYLTTPAINCAGYTDVHLSFQRWLGIELKTWDHARIDVSANGSVWNNVWENPDATIQDVLWTNIILDISGIADGCSTVYIRWGLGPTDEIINYCGWNIDDIELWGLSATTSIAAFSAEIYSFRENAGTVSVTILRSGLLTGTSTVNFAAFSGTASSGADFVPTNGVLTFNPGVTSMAFNVRLMDDAAVESNEYISLVLSNASAGTMIRSPGTAQVLLRDDEAPKAPFPFYEPFNSAVLSNYWNICTTATARTRFSTSYSPYHSVGHLCMDVADYTGAYGLNEAVLTVNLHSQTSVMLNVWTKSFNDGTHQMPNQFDGSVNADGIALSEDGVRWHKLWTPVLWDYNPNYTNILVDLSAFAAARGIPLAEDMLIKFQQYDCYPMTSRGRSFDEVRLYEPSTAADVKLSMTDSEDPAQTGSNLLYTICITNAGPAVAAGLSASNSFPSSINILSATSSVGTCGIFGRDVICSLGDFIPGATAIVEVLTQPTVSGIATVTVQTSSLSLDAYPINNRATQTTLISEPGGCLQFQAGSYHRPEGSNVLITVTRTNAFYGTVQVNYTTSNGTATAGTDYVHASGTLTFASGVVSSSFNVAMLDDAVPESMETFSVHLSAPTGGAVLGSPDTTDVSIQDDDGTAPFPFVETFESGSFSNFWRTCSGSGGRIQITTNLVPGTGARHVTLDGDGSYIFALNEIILNVDLAGQQGVILNFWHKEFSDNDHLLPAQFTNHYIGDGVSVSVNGTNWYKAQGLTSADGISNAYRQFEVPLDGLIASNGLSYTSQFKIKFQQYGYAPIPSDGFAFDDITLYALAGTLQFSTNTLDVNESETAVTVTVVRANGNSGEVTVDYTASSGTADGGFDFTAQTGMLAFAAGQMTNTFVIPILDDEDDEPGETILLALSSPSGGAVLGSLSNAVVNIIDDDGPGDLMFPNQYYSFPESAGIATVSVERINGLDGTVSVNWSLAAGSAAPGADYTDQSDILLFGDGQAGAEIEIEILDDMILESNETFTVWLHDPGGGAWLASPPSTATVTIIDNELAYFQGFEGSEEDNWNCAFFPGDGTIITNGTRAMSGSKCLQLSGSAAYINADPHVIFDNIDISTYSNVLLSVAFSAAGPDTDDDLWLDLSYDNGLTWNGAGSVKLVDGFSNAAIPFGGTAGGEPLTVSTNPWIAVIPDAAGQIKVRIRFDERSGNYNNSSDHYYIDDIRLYFLPPDQPPVITATGSVSTLVSNLTSFIVTATDIDHDPIALTADGLPAGAGFSVVTNGEIVEGTFTFIPDVTQAGGVYTSYFHAADGDGTATQAVVISVFDKQVNILHAPSIVNEEHEAFSFTVSVSRAAGTAVSLQFSGTAGEGSDYTASETSLYFAVNAPLEQTITISLNDDTLAEGLETIVISLTDALNGEIGPASSRTVDLRDNDSFTLASANLTTTGLKYKDPGNRIIAGVRPDIIAIQEFNVTNGSHRAWVDQHLGEDYHYIVETNRSLPNGVISRWPITDWGQWDDAQLSDREFVWATIDVPGDRDLHIISVHLFFSGGAAARELEGRALTNYIATAGFDPDDYYALCGDFNSQHRQEAVVLVLTQMVSDLRKPACQLGDTDTNQNRDKPYDWVLPSPRLDAKHLPLGFEGESFPDGMVFDTRLWTSPPPPVLTSDSGAQDMQHMLVMKLFSLRTNFMILTTAGGNGTVDPVNPEVAEAGEQPFTIAAAAYHHISGLRTNGGSMTLAGSPAVLDFTWSNVLENGSLDVTFDENLTDHGVPEWWLASHGWTQNFSEVVNSDQDNDRFFTWEEYHANTVPTNGDSYLHFEDVMPALTPGEMVLSWQSASNRMYQLSVSTNGFENFDVVDNAIPATPVMNIYTVQVISADGVIYRISIAP